jgi:hypothetical protein
LIETFGPEALVAVEPLIGAFHRFGAQAAGDCASGFVADEQAGVREDVDVLHHRRQRHREGLGEFADRNRILFAQAREQRASGRIGEGRKSAVQILRSVVGSIVNHLVKYRGKGGRVKGVGIIYISLRNSP